jgi:hypothetical protein
MAAHALLGASSAYRWLECPPSARFEATFKDPGSLFALEGTIAHAVAEYCLTHELEDAAVLEQKNAFDLIPELEGMLKVFPDATPKQMTEELIGMRRYVERYLDYVYALPGERFTEQRVDFSHLVPEGFGTADAIIMNGDTVEVVDLKYGKGIKVFADGPQTKLYALGALNEYGFIFDSVTKVNLHIMQPRLDHVDVHEMTIEALVQWGNDIKEIAKLAFKGEGEYKAGAHCDFCKAGAVCRKRAEFNMQKAKDEFGEPCPTTDRLTLEEIAALLEQLPQIIKWANTVQNYALEKALAGEEVPGYKVVEGRSTRKWSDEVQVAESMRAAGLTNDQIYNMKLIGMTEAEKLLGKKSEVFQLAERSPGSPTLVPLRDKRPAMGIASARRDFEEA